MKVFAGLIVAASATRDRIVTAKSWPANTDAPHCGCQIIIDPNDVQFAAPAFPDYAGGHINATCTISFPYADNYGRGNTADPHFVSIASTYMAGRDRVPSGPDGFKFTGFDEVTSPDVLDILVFYENADCAREGRDVTEIPSLPESERWEVYNISSTQGDAMCEYVLQCEPNTDGNGNQVARAGVHLGNFNYDIARSVQTYTVPIYGLEKDESATFDIVDYYNRPNNCMNPLAHHGHGTASGCSTPATNTTDAVCGNSITFAHDQDHNGMLEYFQFEPVSIINSPECSIMPEHHDEDYQWWTPSPWDTQQNYNDLNGF
jgi:hypothetical protein